MSTDNSEKISFEDAFEKLEAIVEKLERGESMLDDSIKSLEEGMELVRICTERLNQAETRLQKLIKKEDGTFDLKPAD